MCNVVMSLYPMKIFGLSLITPKSRSGNMRIPPQPPLEQKIASTLSFENMLMSSLALASSFPAKYPWRVRFFVHSPSATL